MKVLVACEESQAVTIEFRKKGHEAYSCDIIECSGGHPEWHIMQDVLPLLNGNCEFETTDGTTHKIEGKWDMIIAFPPCTFLTNTGNRWFVVEKYGEKAIQRMKDREAAAEFFMRIANADCDKIIIENPIGYMSSFFRKPDQIIHPYYFAEAENDENCERKATCLWLKGVEPLQYEIKYQPRIITYKNGKGTDSPWHMNTMGLPKEERAKVRSKTFPGIAKAMADQWGDCSEVHNVENINKREEEKEMELRVNEVTLPEAISFNYEELKAELTAKISKYETMVYSDDQIKNAKEDRANLNKLKKALNDERIRREKEYMQPFNVFKAQVNEIISIIDKPIGLIDGQVKEYEEAQKKEKLEKCKLIFEAVEKPDWLNFEQIFNQKWLNASVNQKTITTEIETAIETINNNLSALQILPEFSFEAIEVYKTTLDINRALEEGKRLAEIQKKKAEAEAQMMNQGIASNATEAKEAVESAVQQATEQSKEWIAFKALLSTEDAQQLAAFFKSREIQYKAI